jgi:GTP pyrophosphokinase
MSDNGHDSQSLEARMGAIVDSVRQYHPAVDADKLWQGFRAGLRAHEGQVRKSGEPYFIHPLSVAENLAELRMDADTIVAGLLHDAVEDTALSVDDLSTQFGNDVAVLVDGVTKINEIKHENPEAQQAENYRKMLLTMARDVRVILIKLADRLHNMRTISALSADRQLAIAQETLNVYAPLAHRFGIGRIKWELEDLSFKVLNPEEYREVEDNIDSRREDRERLIEEMQKPLAKLLRKANIDAELTGRAKHFYSIWQKMQNTGLGFDQIFDLLAMRVLVGTTAECYAVLGLVHSKFTPLHDRLKDYIANPKSNMYQSLHTTVNGPGGRLVEVQIRTQEMHSRAEMGIAAHWRYKEGGKSTDDPIDEQLRWFREILDWQLDVSDPREFMDALKTDIFQDEIYVFSPAGDVFKLPNGSTPLDFAFYVHSQVGLHCVGARVDKRLVPLRYQLKSGETIEILTKKNSKPSKNWLSLVKTSRAKHHIRHWIRATQFDESLGLGREMLERELKKRGVELDLDVELIDVAQSLGHIEVDGLLAAIGSGAMKLQKVANRLAPQEERKRRIRIPERLSRAFQRRNQSAVAVQGVGNLLIRYARCCQPVPGDDITGIITTGQGVSVHREDCQNLEDPNLDRDRLIEVSWDVEKDATFPVQLGVIGQDRKNLLADISRAIGDFDCNIQSGSFDGAHEYARCTFMVEVRNLAQLERIIVAIKRLKGVSEVERSVFSGEGGTAIPMDEVE